MNNRNKDVEIIHRINKLKKKAGISLTSGKKGVVDHGAVKRAQQVIDDKETDYPPTVKELIDQIGTLWKSVKDMSSEEEQKQALETIYHLSNNIKDITDTYGHNLMHHFSLSLRDFCEIVDLKKPEHNIIVEAHLNVMLITYEERLKSDETAQAEELKNIVKIAIEKFS